MNIEKLLHWSYLWQRYSPIGFSWPIRILLLIFFVGSICLAIWFHRKIKNSQGPKKTLAKKIRAWGITTGLIGLLLMSFREIQAVYLGSRLFLLVWLIIITAWLVSIFIYRYKDLPKKQAALEAQAEFNKWLPQNKK
jgi:flagellar biogenesis protein FliO